MGNTQDKPKDESLVKVTLKIDKENLPKLKPLEGFKMPEKPKM